MGVIASNSYLAAFGAGTFVGIASTYVFLKFKYNWHPQPKRKVQQDPGWYPGMEEKYEFEDTEDDFRLMLGIRNDLKMQKGKVAAQCGHAAMAAYAKTVSVSSKLLKQWRRDGTAKIALRVDNEEQLLELEEKAKKLNVLTCVIRDAGQTQVAPGSRTVIAIGPAPKRVLDKITGSLKLY